MSKRPPRLYVGLGIVALVGLSGISALAKSGDQTAQALPSVSVPTAAATAPRPTTTGAIPTPQIESSQPPVEPKTPAVVKPAPTPIVSVESLYIEDSHAFSGGKQTYRWADVTLEYDLTKFKITGTAPKTKSCKVTWNISDGDDRNGFTLTVSPNDTKSRSRAYDPAVTTGTVSVKSTCRSWSIRVAEYVPPAPKLGVFDNPWGYDFRPGKKIYDPPGEFCSYFDCIASFWDSTNGYVAQCTDGSFTHSGGRPGVCSYHDGYRRTLYSH